MPTNPPEPPKDATPQRQPLNFGRRRPASPPRPPELRAFAANDEGPAGAEGPVEGSAAFRAEVAPLLAVLGYHLADPTVMAPPPPAFVERRKAPRTIDRLTELEAQIARQGDPSGLRHRLRRLLLSELELLGVVGRRREDRPLAEAAARALRG